METVEIARWKLHKCQAIKNSKDMFQTAVEGKGSTWTGQQKSSRAADFREKTNHDEIPKEQEEVKKLRNLTTDSFGDFNLRQNGGYQSNRSQSTRPSTHIYDEASVADFFMPPPPPTHTVRRVDIKKSATERLIIYVCNMRYCFVT